MKTIAFRMICRLLIVAMALMPFQAVHAGMIGTDRIAPVAGADADRAAVLSILNRAEVQTQLQSMGVDPKTAGDRVMALSDEELGALAGKLHSVPAGEGIGASTILLVIIIWLAIYFINFAK